MYLQLGSQTDLISHGKNYYIFYIDAKTVKLIIVVEQQ